jgi:Protein of unknown function (DUF3553)
VSARLIPGAYVRHPLEPAWGIGQVQSAVGNRVTVNFEHAGKKLINVGLVRLVSAEDAAARPGAPISPAAG